MVECEWLLGVSCPSEIRKTHNCVTDEEYECVDICRCGNCYNEEGD